MRNKDLLQQISDEMRQFSKGQKRIANYILEHYDKAAFMTAAKLGAAVGVSESTVVRFASEMGFEGYPELQRALQEMIRNKLTAVQRIEITSDRISNTDLLSKVLAMDIEKIRRTQEETSEEDFEQVVDALVGARRIYILGVRSCAFLAGFLSFYFYNIFENVRNVATSSTSEAFEQIMNIDVGDVFFAITFPRYSTRTLKAAKYARDRGATVIALTDSRSAPIVEFADKVLLARSDMASFADSLVAPLSLLNALIVAIGIRRRDEVSETFRRLERIWDEYEVYQKIDREEAAHV